MRCHVVFVYGVAEHSLLTTVLAGSIGGGAHRSLDEEVVSAVRHCSTSTISGQSDGNQVKTCTLLACLSTVVNRVIHSCWAYVSLPDWRFSSENMRSPRRTKHSPGTLQASVGCRGNEKQAIHYPPPVRELVRGTAFPTSRRVTRLHSRHCR